MQIGGYTTAVDASAADWVIAGLRGFAASVLSVVPADFEAYARIFHPAELGPGRLGPVDESEIRSVSWQEVAAANNRVLHRRMQWPHLVGSWEEQEDPQGVCDHPPAVGSLAPRQLAVTLAQLLADYTTVPQDCFFAIWEGWGGLVVPETGTASFSIPHRRMLLLTGPVTAVGATLEGPEPIPHQSPNLWWPADRAWCVATEIDFNTTYLGASQDCVDAVLASPAIEADAIDSADGVTAYSDTVNPPPPC